MQQRRPDPARRVHQRIAAFEVGARPGEVIVHPRLVFVWHREGLLGCGSRTFSGSGLDAIKDGETNRGLLARIVGRDRFDGVNKKLGSRELFFIYLLFTSTRSHDVAGERMTVITEDEAVQALLQWRDNGYLRFSGKDEDTPAYRVQKMWGEFVRQMEKERNLKKLFTSAHKDLKGQKLYGLRLRHNEKQILV